MKNIFLLRLILLILFFCHSLSPIFSQSLSKISVPPRSKVYRIGIISFAHETCTFCPEPASLDDWLATGPATDKLLGNVRDYIIGFESRMQVYGGVELVGITSPAGNPFGGISRSWNSKEVWDYFTIKIIEDLKQKGPFDGIYLALHGSMAVAGIARPEAELARIVRKVVGDKAIIAVTLDLHACVDAELVAADAADGVFSVKRFPHYDSNLMGERAADMMIKSIEGKYVPYAAVRKPGIISPSFFQGTVRYPAREIMERARRWENRTRDVYVSVNFGFAYADVPDNGASVFVITNNDSALAEQIADDMNEFIWRHRKDLVFKEIYDTNSGVEQIMKAVKAGRTPVIVADGCDRTGGATWITNQLIKENAANFCIGTLTDKPFFEEAEKKSLKPGMHTGPIKVGGTTDMFSGEPVSLNDAIVEFINNSYIVLLFGNNNRIVVTPELNQVTTPEWHASVGVKFDDLDIIVHKTRVHFFSGYYETGIAGDGNPGTIIKIEVPGWGPADIRKITYKNGGQYLYPNVMDREMGYIWDRPYIGNEDMVYITGEGKSVE